VRCWRWLFGKKIPISGTWYIASILSEYLRRSCGRRSLKDGVKQSFATVNPCHTQAIGAISSYIRELEPFLHILGNWSHIFMYYRELEPFLHISSRRLQKLRSAQLEGRRQTVVRHREPLPHKELEPFSYIRPESEPFLHILGRNWSYFFIYQAVIGAISAYILRSLKDGVRQSFATVNPCQRQSSLLDTYWSESTFIIVMIKWTGLAPWAFG